MRSIRPSVVASFLSFLVACGGGAASAPPQAPADTPAAPAPSGEPESKSSADAPKEKEEAKAEAPPLEIKPPTVRLLEPGAAPRRALRYKFKAGVTEYVEMDMKMSLAISMGGKEGAKNDFPTMRTTMRLDAKEVTPEGDLRSTFETEKVEVLKDGKLDPNVGSALEKELAGMVGLKGSARISPRGVASEMEFELPPTASPKLKTQLDSMRDAFRNMYMPLPEEEVGKGAKWEVTSRLPLTGAAMDVKAIYALTKLQADTAQADVELTLTAEPNQAMHVAGLPPGAVATLDSLVGKGSGKVSPAFSKLVSSGTNKLSMENAFSVAAQGERLSMKMASDILVSVRPGKGTFAAGSAKR